MVFHIYVLYSPGFAKIYVGYTADLIAGVKSHNELATKGWTIKFRPWVLIHSESFSTKAAAIKREIELKAARGRQFIYEEILKRARRAPIRQLADVSSISDCAQINFFLLQTAFFPVRYLLQIWYDLS